MKPNRERRRFLKATGATIGGVAVVGLTGCGSGNAAINAPDNIPPNNTPEPDDPPKGEPKSGMTMGTLLCGSNIMKDAKDTWVFVSQNLDTIAQQIQETGSPQPRFITDIGFLAHGVIPHPFDASRVLTFEKKGDGGAEIDLKSNTILRRIKPTKGHEFYGHGAYSPDAKLVYDTEYDETTYEGKIVVRDAATMKPVGDFPSYGEWPHDCWFIDGGKTVVVANGGGHIEGGAKPCVCYVDVASGDLIEKLEFTNPRINAAHLLLNADKDLAVASAVREGLDVYDAPGAITLRPKGGSYNTMTDPAKVTAGMKGETLSLAYHIASGVLAATNPYGNVVTFWNMKKQSYVGAFPVAQPRGVAVTLDGAYWVVTFGKKVKSGPAQYRTILVRTDTGKPDKQPLVVPLPCGGSHAFIHDYAV